MPDRAVDFYWQNALDHYEAAADSLVYGVDNYDVAAAADSLDSMEMGNDQLALATEELERR